MINAVLEATREFSIEAEEIHAACKEIVASEMFVNSPRMCRFLCFLVEKAILGDRRETSEYNIGLEVFDRKPASYNTADDPVVRVQAGRLRKRLESYYEKSLHQSRIKISIPQGRYMPVISRLNEKDTSKTQGNSLVIRSIKCIALSDGVESIAHGLRDELIHQLYKTFDEIVISSSLREITATQEKNAQASDAAHLEGSFRVDANKLRASIRLINGSFGNVAWAEQFDVERFMGISQQEQFAISICKALQEFII